MGRFLERLGEVLASLVASEMNAVLPQTAVCHVVEPAAHRYDSSPPVLAF